MGPANLVGLMLVALSKPKARQEGGMNLMGKEWKKIRQGAARERKAWMGKLKVHFKHPAGVLLCGASPKAFLDPCFYDRPSTTSKGKVTCQKCLNLLACQACPQGEEHCEDCNCRA